VDGPAAAGKGTLARRLAAELGLPYLDTGLLYRAVARRVLDSGGDPADAAGAGAAARALTEADLARGDLRTPEVDVASSQVAALPEVRAALLGFQRRFGAAGGVLDGRDIGTVVFPEAGIKLFVTATTEARARRRWRELHAQNAAISYESVLADLQTRDRRDAARLVAPLRPAHGALILDTTETDADAAFAAALALVRERLRGR
jgi:cytidylate kinase